MEKSLSNFFGPSDHEIREEDLERVEIRALWRIWWQLERIVNLLTPNLHSARIQIMPKTVKVGEVAKATIVGLDQNGQPFTIDTTYQVAYSASSPADVSIGTPGIDGSADVTALAEDVGDVISAVITRPDGQVVIASADTLTIEPAAPPAPVLTSASVVLQ